MLKMNPHAYAHTQAHARARANTHTHIHTHTPHTHAHVHRHLQAVAEMTGRQKRMLRQPDGTYAFVPRTQDSNCSMDQVRPLGTFERAPVQQCAGDGFDDGRRA